MIPLGSCTMKLNATTEMVPLSWREFNRLHPFAPREQAPAYRTLSASSKTCWPRSPASQDLVAAESGRTGRVQPKDCS